MAAKSNSKYGKNVSIQSVFVVMASIESALYQSSLIRALSAICMFVTIKFVDIHEPKPLSENNSHLD